MTIGRSNARRIAAIDLGTNTTLMLLAEVEPDGRLRVLQDLATITRLGRGVDRTKHLDEAAIERTLAVLRDYASRAQACGAKVVAVGTSALRDALNRDAFLKPAEAILGCQIQAIAGALEAELTFLGALEGIEVGPLPLTVVDVGGGSTEIIVGSNGVIRDRISLDVGSVRMHERHKLAAPMTDEQMRSLRSEIRAELSRVPFDVAPRLLAIAGTATTLSAMAQAIDPYDPARVHGSRLSAGQLREQTTRLATATLDERKRFRGLHPDRADVIAAGAVILEELLAWTQAPELIVSDGGVRFGLARRSLAQNSAD